MERPGGGLTFKMVDRVAFPIAVLLALSVLVFPAWSRSLNAAATRSSGGGHAQGAAVGLEELVRARPYHAPDAAANSDPLSKELYGLARTSCQRECLPASLLSRDGDKTLKEQGADGPTGAGTGGWTPLTRLFNPSADPAVTYEMYPGPSSNNVIDINGVRHDIYSMQTSTDVSQFPDGAGFQMETPSKLFYASYTEGVWSTPVSLTPVSGLQDTVPLLFETDDDGYLHLIYSRWTWARDSSLPAGDHSAYQHSNENLFYRCRAPDGTWSAPRQLTSFSGMWEITDGYFFIQDNRIYCGWTEQLNKEAGLPSSYTARIMFMEGSREDWDAAGIVRHWDYTMVVGGQFPIMSPYFAVSPVTGEVTLIYNIVTSGALPFQHKTNLYGMVRSPAGSWSSPKGLTSSALNEYWIGMFIRYNSDGISTSLLTIRENIYTFGPTFKPQSNIYLIRRDSGGWKAPMNATHLPEGQDFASLDLALDPWDMWHLTVSSATYQWDGVSSTWKPAGNQLRYTHQLGDSFSSYQTILGYHAGRYIDAVNGVLDRDGKLRSLFETHLTDPTAGTDYKAYYSDNTSGSSFSSPTKLSADSGQTIEWTYLSTDSKGGTIAS